MTEQLVLPLDEPEDDRIYIENLTLSSDLVLARAIGCFDKSFIIGVTSDGLEYRSNDHDAAFWIFALEKAKSFLLDNMR